MNEDISNRTRSASTQSLGVHSTASSVAIKCAQSMAVVPYRLEKARLSLRKHETRKHLEGVLREVECVRQVTDLANVV